MSSFFQSVPKKAAKPKDDVEMQDREPAKEKQDEEMQDSEQVKENNPEGENLPPSSPQKHDPAADNLAQELFG